MATYTVGDSFDFGKGVARALVIPPEATKVEVHGTLTLPPGRPPGKLWPILGPALGDKDRKRVKPAVLTIGDQEQWRIEGPGIEREQKGGEKVTWGATGAFTATWDAHSVTVTFGATTLFSEPLDSFLWDTSKGGLLWLGVNAGGHYFPLAGGVLTIESADFGTAGSGGGTGGGGVDAFAEFDKSVAAAVAKLKGELVP